MSRLRDDGEIYDEANKSAAVVEKNELENHRPTKIGTSEWRDPSLASSNYGSSSQQNQSVISDITQSEYSCFVSLSEDEQDGMRKNISQPIEKSLSPLSATAVAAAQLLSTTPRKSKGFPPKPPISLHRPPSIPSLTTSQTNDSNYSCETELSHTNRSFVTTGSGFSEASTSSPLPSQSLNGSAAKNPHQQILTKLSAGDSSSSLTSLHRRAVPMLYDGSSQASVEEALSKPSSTLPVAAGPKQPPPPISPWNYDQQDVLFVERNRLDSEVSALGMGSGLEEEENSHKQTSPTCKYTSSDDEDLVNHSPFPLLQHKGEGRLPHRPKGGATDRERKPLQTLPPPPPPPPAMAKPSLFEHPLKQKGGRNNTEKEHHKLQRKWKRGSTQEMTGQKLRMESSQPMKFLSKSAVLEERILARKNRRVVVSGWIVVLFGRADKMSNSSISSNSSSTGAKASLSPGFGADDLYYMCIVEDSRNSASLILHRSTDGSVEYVFPIEDSWVVQSRESEDRRVGRSISVKFGEGGNGSDWLFMVPVALQDRWRAILDFNLRNGTSEKPVVLSTSREADHISSDHVFLLPPPGRYASGKQLDIARHLFFTIDSFVKQHR